MRVMTGRFRILAMAVIVAAGCSVAERSSLTDPSSPSPAITDIAAGHSTHGEAFDEGPRQRAFLMAGTGNAHLSVSTSKKETQRFFDQGLGQLHGFWYFEAERSFRQASAIDPDCAMPYWGMASANIENEKRARGFIAEAVKRLKSVSDIERMHIEASAAYYKESKDAKKTKTACRTAYLAALSAIMVRFPDEIETKALTVRYRWEFRSEVKLEDKDYADNDALLNQIFASNPMHPAHHYRIHLWDEKDAARALVSAGLCGQSAPSIAHMWHMPGHIYSKLKRFDDAAWQQEASARIDHAHMMHDQVLPDQIHNYAHNNEWLCRDLMTIGRVSDALALATNMTELPRHPKYNSPDSGSGKYGRERLYDLYYRFELWEPLLTWTDELAK